MKVCYKVRFEGGKEPAIIHASKSNAYYYAKDLGEKRYNDRITFRWFQDGTLHILVGTRPNKRVVGSIIEIGVNCNDYT